MKMTAEGSKFTVSDFWPLIVAIFAIPVILGMPQIIFGTAQKLIEWGLI